MCRNSYIPDSAQNKLNEGVRTRARIPRCCRCRCCNLRLIYRPRLQVVVSTGPGARDRDGRGPPTCGVVCCSRDAALCTRSRLSNIVVGAVPVRLVDLISIDRQAAAHGCESGRQGSHPKLFYISFARRSAFTHALSRCCCLSTAACRSRSTTKSCSCSGASQVTQQAYGADASACEPDAFGCRDDEILGVLKSE